MRIENSLQRALRSTGLAPQSRVTEKPLKTKSQPLSPYRYRNLPCSCAPADDLWYVEGVDRLGGTGILEWCVSQKDAQHRFEVMTRFPQFCCLAVAKYQEGVSINHLVAKAISH